METYQLRLPNGMNLESLVDETAHGLWRLLGWHKLFQDLDPHLFPMLQSKLRLALTRHVRTYDVCGSHPVCDDCLEPSPWTSSDPERFVQPRAWKGPVVRLSVQVAADLDELLSSLEMEVFKLLFSSAERAPLGQTLAPDIENVIKQVFGPHLYQNLSCGTAPVCRHRNAVDPWDAPSK